MAQLDLLGSNDSAVPPLQALPSFFSQKKPMITEPIEAHAAKAEGAYKTISEVAEELDVPTHVLRFWESRFPQVKPQRMRGGRRYYRPADVETLKKIKTLLYSQGYTIKGAKKHVKDKSHEIHAEALPQVAAPVVAKAPVMPAAPVAVPMPLIQASLAAAGMATAPLPAKPAPAARKAPPAELGVLLSELRDLRKKLLAFH